MGASECVGGGAFDQGIIRYVIIMVLMLLFPLFGLMFHSGTRHAYALGDRKLVKGHRWQIVGLWLSGLLFVLPMAVCIVALIAQVSVSAVQFTMQWFENLMDMPSFSMLMPPKWAAGGDGGVRRADAGDESHAFAAAGDFPARREGREEQEDAAA